MSVQGKALLGMLGMLQALRVPACACLWGPLSSFRQEASEGCEVGRLICRASHRAVPLENP